MIARPVCRFVERGLDLYFAEPGVSSGRTKLRSGSFLPGLVIGINQLATPAGTGSRSRCTDRDCRAIWSMPSILESSLRRNERLILDQSFFVGVLPWGSFCNCRRISLMVKPKRWAAMTNESRRMSARTKRLWPPEFLSGVDQALLFVVSDGGDCETGALRDFSNCYSGLRTHIMNLIQSVFFA